MPGAVSHAVVAFTVSVTASLPEGVTFSFQARFLFRTWREAFAMLPPVTANSESRTVT